MLSAAHLDADHRCAVAQSALYERTGRTFGQLRDSLDDALLVEFVTLAGIEPADLGLVIR